MTKIQAEKCLVPQCQRASMTCRGLCISHYNAAAQMVHRKQTTWAELEEKGKVKSALTNVSYSYVKNYFLGD